jgi:cysteine desulfurase
MIGANPEEVLFTSGATESNNLALKGISLSGKEHGRDHIVTTQTEHKAVRHTCEKLKPQGFKVSVLPVDEYGCLDPDRLRRAIRPNTCVVSLMAANNETGVLHDLDVLNHACRSRGVPLHTDAAQAFGKIPLDVDELGIDMLSISAHKIYGPKGIGALYVREGVPVQSQMDGGGQERGVRGGTLAVPNIVGFGVAAEIAQHEMQRDASHCQKLTDLLVELLSQYASDMRIIGEGAPRLPNTAALCFPGVSASWLLAAVEAHVSATSGSACSSGNSSPSHVLKAMGLADNLCLSTIRLSVGRFTTEEECRYAAEAIGGALRDAPRVAGAS